MTWRSKPGKPLPGTGFATFGAKPKSMNTKFSPLLLLLVAPLLAFTAAHKFYLSVTNVDYSEKEQSLQIISRIFIDDMEAVLEARYEVSAALATEGESSEADAYIEKYFRSKFAVSVNGEAKDFRFLGKRYDKDLLVCYIEVAGVPQASLKSVEITNSLLTDLFDEQRNLVHFNILGTKRSFVLTSEGTKGMLNL